MQFTFDETQQMIVDVARELAERRVAPLAERIEQERRVPDELFADIAGAGILGICFPEEYGGIDAGHIPAALAVEEIAKASMSAASCVLAAITPLEAIKNYGSEALRQRYLPAGIEGSFRGSFAFTEADTGSDPKQLRTTAAEDGDFFVLNGTKRFITNACYPGPIIIWAQDPGAEKGVSAFIVDKFCPGYSLSQPWDLMSMRGSPVFDVYLDNVRVPRENLLGARGQGFDILEGTVAHSKTLICAGNVGLMEAAYKTALDYVRAKQHRGVSIGKFQGIQLQVAQVAAKVESARLMTLRLAGLSDDRTDLKRLEAWVGMTKAYVANEAVEAIRLCMDLMGSYSISTEYRMERYMRDALLGPQIEGVDNIQKVMAGSYILFSGDDLI